MTRSGQDRQTTGPDSAVASKAGFLMIEHCSKSESPPSPGALPGTFGLQAWVQAQIQPRLMASRV